MCAKKSTIEKKTIYKYETHLHTSEGSKCATNTSREMVYRYKEAGYTGIFVTDHFFYGNTAADRSLPWSDWVDAYCRGYEIAKKVGDAIGLQVFFGWEASYDGTDFLVYGLDKAWLKSHPEIKDASIEEQYKLVHASGGIVVHAHPFRLRGNKTEAPLYPEFVDAVETINAAHLYPEARKVLNDKAMEYAIKHNLPQTGGSDSHNIYLMGGGMGFYSRLNSTQDFIEAVLSRKNMLLPE